MKRRLEQEYKLIALDEVPERTKRQRVGVGGERQLQYRRECKTLKDFTFGSAAKICNCEGYDSDGLRETDLGMSL